MAGDARILWDPGARLAGGSTSWALECRFDPGRLQPCRLSPWGWLWAIDEYRRVGDAIEA